MQTHLPPKSTIRPALTARGRVRAVLLELDRRWPTLTEPDKAEALRLVDRLADCYRVRPRMPLPPFGGLGA